MIRTLTLAAVATLATTALPARAEGIAVRYGDLDLSSPAGRTTFERRIATAARTICRVNGSRDLGEVIASQNCFRGAIQSTRTQMAALVSKKTRGTL
jgi:UrcA family protein